MNAVKNTGQTLVLKKDIDFYEYFVVFLLVIYAGNASIFVQALENWDNIAGLMLPLISVSVLAIIKGTQFSFKYWLFIFGFTIYFAISTFKFGELHPRFYGIQIINFTLAYIVISSLRFRFFLIYENILYYLCIIALGFWVLQNMFPTTFVEILRSFEFSSQRDVNGNVDFNTIVYTVSNFDFANENYILFGKLHLIRNAGFAWEPGAFATYVNLALLFNLLRNKFKLTEINHLLVFGLTLFSTFSTTGYSIFVVLVLYYIYNQNITRISWMIPITTVIVMLLFTLPFMSNKITQKSTVSAEELVYYSAKYNNSYGAQRFQSLQIDFIDFLNHPLIGYGGHQDASWTRKWKAHVVSVSGLGQIMAQYGSVGILFFLFSIWQSSKQITMLFNAKGIFFPALVVLMISLSYGIFVVIYMCVWLLNFSNFFKYEIFRRYTLRFVYKRLLA